MSSESRDDAADVPATRRSGPNSSQVDLGNSLPAAFLFGAIIGVLGGMIGLGGAEFRLPLLIGLFGFIALQA
ncbi:MAG: hypothetical protein U5N53_15145 [Mycobacterium sp.]|nr:hypothetical protein [Mycobacterium sp.]